MSDPLDVLRTPVAPAAPDPAFAARLRARIQRALALPQGAVVSTSMLGSETGSGAAPPELSAAIPYLAVREARRALDWYADVLDARLRGEPVIMPDGRVGHAELDLAGGVVYLADEHPEIGFAAPEPDAASVSLVLTVPDVDATVARAVRAGGRLTHETYEAYGHRNATVVDPFGHRWMLQTPLGPAPGGSPASYRHGDIGYTSLWVPDAAKAAAFFGAVLGWTYAPGSSPQGRQVQGTTPPQGIWGEQERSMLFCCYVVDDVVAAVQRVRAAGGDAAEPTQEPYGLIANCVDDQGVAFAVYELPSGEAAGARPPASGARAGDIAYVTMQVVDSAAARAFYGEVLGWRFARGRVEDGWGVEDIVPMTGVSGGHPEATVVPMWRVDDIASAVARVRDSGGTSTDPQRQPYGLMAECTDDQGTRFYLGQM
jgi:predicted enzyme related to lactoylglutathione lyase